jgi:hypothetical protein
MQACFTFRRAATAAAAGVVIALSFSSVAQAITDTIFRYSSPKTGYYMIDRMAMSPQDTTAAGASFSIDAGDGGLTAGTQACFVTGVNLPQGATITGARVWYRSGAGGNPIVNLVVHRLSDGQVFLIAGQTLVDDSALRKAVNITVPAGQTVDNAGKSYGLQICLWPQDVFYALRIAYTYNQAGD